MVIIDGIAGDAVIDPTADQLAEYEQKAADFQGSKS